MNSSLQPYLISEFKTGINTYLQPWMRPQDAFSPLVNAYTNRGSINKRVGYSKYGNTVPDGNPIMGIMQWDNEDTGATSLVVATTVNLYLYDPGTGNYNAVASPPTFTGNISNFFNWTNWQASPGATSYLWMVNNKDAVTNFDGTTADQPTITIDGTPTTITTALDVKVYKQRLLLIRPTLSAGGIQNQSIYWSQQQNPVNWRVDIAGQGGFLAAPTGDSILSAEFIRDVLVVFFTNSTWIFRYTGNDTAPFRWDKVNNSKSTNAPYGSIDYDQRCTSIGSTGFIACDGVNVQRYDIPIIDYYNTNFSIQFYAQAFGQRYDNIDQGWMLYVSSNTPFPNVGGVAPGSDSALIYNFVENSFATYTFKIPLTCMGLFFNQGSVTWSSLKQSWEDTDMSWNSYTTQFGSPILLAGDTTGHVWYMDDNTQITDKKAIDNELIAVGNGGSLYSGVLTSTPITPGSFIGTDGIETFTDNSEGILTGDAGGSGTINYITGAWTFTFGAPVMAATDITATYTIELTIDPDITTTRWNPIIQSGQKVQFSYIDIYYQVASTDSNNPASVFLDFYANNSEDPAITKTMILDGPITTSYTFKRVYVNIIGEFFQMGIRPETGTFVKFLGFILWCQPAGRLTL